MSDLICRKTMMRCPTPGMCAPHGGCSTSAEAALNSLAERATAPAPAAGVKGAGDTIYEVLFQRNQELIAERDGANERAGLLLKAKDEWAERARAAEAELDRLQELSVERILLDVVPGDGEGHEVYAKSVEEVEVALTAEAERAESLEAERDQLRADVEALRHLAGELYQVLGALDAPAGVLDAVLAAANGEPMEGRGSLLPFVSDEHETLRKDAERYRLLRRVTIEVHDGSDAEFDAEFDFAIDAALAAKEGA